MDFKSLLENASSPPRVPALNIGVTGHRPDKIGGYEFGNPIRRKMRERIRLATENLIHDAKRDGMDAHYRDTFLSRVIWQHGWDISEKWRSIEVLCLHGGAQGVDQDSAAVWYLMGLPYVVVVPFPKQDRIWPEAAQARFRKV